MINRKYKQETNLLNKCNVTIKLRVHNFNFISTNISFCYKQFYEYLSFIMLFNYVSKYSGVISFLSSFMILVQHFSYGGCFYLRFLLNLYLRLRKDLKRGNNIISCETSSFSTSYWRLFILVRSCLKIHYALEYLRLLLVMFLSLYYCTYVLFRNYTACV